MNRCPECDRQRTARWSWFPYCSPACRDATSGDFGPATVPTDPKGETMFFTYRQNNSGGSFVFDPAAGISVVVIIEARSARVADALAQGIGLYFDGDGDCPCCGDRWYSADDGYYNGGDTEPRIYGTPVAEYEPHAKWMRAGEAETFVHYADGTIEGFHNA